MKRTYLLGVGLAVLALACAGALVSAVVVYSHAQDAADRTLDRLELVTKENAKASVALCALRAERVRSVNETTRRIFETRQFIKDHPDGFADVSVADLRLALVNLKRSREGMLATITSLQILDCKEER